MMVSYPWSAVLSPDLHERLCDALAGRYQLSRELGRGGMAVVYLARELKHDRWVALKVMHPRLTTVMGAERFIREVRVTARLDHPHILAVHDSGQGRGFLWYTMPYVEGGSLRQRLDREARLPVGEALRLARELADALDYAHGQGIVHRDVKPENILLARGHARLGDFGLARALQASSAGPDTGTGVAVGTLDYMSPEQASGDRVDGRSDIYALGCVLYEMLAGEQPYVGPTPQAALARRLLGPPAPLGTLRSEVLAPVERIVTRALAPMAADRFGSAAELRDALAATALPASTGRTARQPRLAVLPFETVGAASDEYFAEGLAEEITSRLAQLGGLEVVSRTTALQYRGTRKCVRQIGRELGAGYVLEGTVRWGRYGRDSDRVRVTPQLIEVAEDRHLWAARYDADPARGFEAQSALAEQVSAALGAVVRRKPRGPRLTFPRFLHHAASALL